MLNASLAGVVEACRAEPSVTALYGAEHGAAGLLEESLIDLYAEDPPAWDRIARMPGSVLGSTRRKVGAEDYARMLDIFARYGVRFVLANGGNGTMQMADELGKAAEASGSGLRVIGIPKTIDNDLFGTDHTPGYGSAARFFASALRDIGADNLALPGVTFVEILGRNAGWLAAACSLARTREDDAPHLIYFPERRLPFERILADVEAVYRRLGRVVVAVCEGQLNEKGEPFGADVRTSSRAPLALNLAHVLAQRTAAALKISARSEKPGLLGRSCSALASGIDRNEARMCGRAAVEACVSGETRRMVTLIREEGPAYSCRCGSIAIGEVAGRERLLPEEWIPAEASADLPEFRAWARPLIGDLETRVVLRRVRIVR